MRKIKYLLVFSIFLTQLALSITWTSRRITYTPGLSQKADIAVYKNNIHVVWAEKSPAIGNYEIFYKRSIDNGQTWVYVKRLTVNTGDSTNPAIAVSGNNIHLVWQDSNPGCYQIYYKKSTDNGLTWSKAKRLTFTCYRNAYYPSIVASGNTIHIVWSNFTYVGYNWEIWYKKSIDNGQTWSSAKRLTYSSGTSDWPSIAVAGNNIHVVWEDNNPGNYEIFYKKSTDNGQTWSSPKKLSVTSGLSLYPVIAVSGNNIHVVFVDTSSGIPNLFYRRSINNGSSWEVKNLTNETTYSCKSPDIAISGNIVSIVFTKWISWLALDICYKRSTDNGQGWTKTLQFSYSWGESLRPAIAISGKYTSIVHVVWEDNSPGNYEIYYKKGEY